MKKNKRDKRDVKLTNIENEKTQIDKSPIIPQRSKFKQSLNIFQRELTEKQKHFLDLCHNKDVKVIFVAGSAGTGKTYLAVKAALEMINSKKVSDLIYIRSAVECSENGLGFLPGEADQKMAPYIQPLLDKLSELLPKSDVDLLLKEERMSAIPIGFLRGLNWNAKVIINDESQNNSYKELFTLITRVGEFSKLILIGDPDQSDLNGRSGFEKMISHFDDEESRENGIYVFRFSDDDIVRSGLVRFIINKIKRVNKTDK